MVIGDTLSVSVKCSCHCSDTVTTVQIVCIVVDVSTCMMVIICYHYEHNTTDTYLSYYVRNVQSMSSVLYVITAGFLSTKQDVDCKF